RSATDTPLFASSRWMAAVSELLPSPGAPVTAGTTAVTGPSRSMLPVVWAGRAAATAAGGLAAVRFASAGAAPVAGWTPALAGWAALEERAPWVAWLGSQARKELAALLAIDCATCGVRAAQGSLEALPETTSSPVMRLTRLPLGSVTSQM